MMVIFARETLSDEMSEDSGHWLGTASAEAQWSCAQNGDCVSMCGARCVCQRHRKMRRPDVTASSSPVEWKAMQETTLT